jgi:Transposase and inactivated derivatives
LSELLTKVGLPRSTYYERLSKTNKTDKYAQLKEFIIKAYYDSNSTYGYRRIWKESLKVGFKNSPETIRHLMTELNLKVVIFSKHTSGYCSYKGSIGKVAPNIIKQKFNEVEPLKVLHTDVTQIRLRKDKWGYISAVLDQASGEILSYSISSTPNKLLILDTLEKLKQNIDSSLKPILHSDQGWHYQLKYYRDALKAMGIKQSMSRKGNCHDNAPY